MKFAIVLLGCLAFAAAVPQQRSTLLQNAEAIVQSIITKAQSDLDTIVNLVTDLTSTSQSQVNSIISSALSQITPAVTTLENKINTLLSQGGTVATCAQQNLAELNGFKDAFGKNVNSCAASFTTSTSTLETDVLAQVSALKVSVSQLVALVEECSVNLAEVFNCVMTKGKEAQNIVESAIAEAANAVETARSKVGATVAKIDECAKHIAGDASIHINKFITAVAACA